MYSPGIYFTSKPQIFNYIMALLLKELLAKSKINLDVFKCRSSLLLYLLFGKKINPITTPIKKRNLNLKNLIVFKQY